MWNHVVMPDTRDLIWSRFGAELRRLRQHAGRTQTDVGRSALMAKATMSAIERGTRAPKQHQAEALDTALSTDGTLTRLWLQLQNQRQVPAWFEDVITLEQRSRVIREYEPTVIPGLLQTADYAKAMIAARHTTKSPDEIDDLVTTRTQRLPTLLQNRPLLLFVIRADGIAQVVGSEKIMSEQRAHIVSLAEEGVVQVQLLPHSPRTAGLCSHFRICALETPQAIIYCENPLGGETYDAPEHIDEMMTLFGQLQAEALPPTTSIEHIRGTQGDLHADMA